MANPVIDHDPDEPPPDTSGNGIYWAAFAALLLLWIGYLALIPIDWHSLVLGAASGLFLGIWGIAVTGNKVPRWMR